MTRAQIAAWEAYPDDRFVDAEYSFMCRGFYQEGYEQAEKDLALTKDDVWRIFNLVRELQTKYPATEGCLQEVADIFNAQHNEHKVE